MSDIDADERARNIMKALKVVVALEMMRAANAKHWKIVSSGDKGKVV